MQPRQGAPDRETDDARADDELIDSAVGLKIRRPGDRCIGPSHGCGRDSQSQRD